MNSDILNTLVLAAVLAAAVGAGLYVTKKRQPAELERLEQEETALRLRQAEVAELLVEQAESREAAEAALRRWNARYKVLPERLSSPEVVDYLNALSASGFKHFDVTLQGTRRQSDHSALSYGVQGRGYLESLYRLVWNVENGRGLYRINDLRISGAPDEVPNPETDIPRMVHLVDFSFSIEAYFGGAEGMSAPEALVSVPEHVLPARAPARDLFFPLVLDVLPPNTDNLVDVERDSLVSVVGNGAVFRDAVGTRSVREGERVYLGTLTSVDPAEARVTADLNKGGIRERVELRLATGERYRQALGPVRLTPVAPPPARPAPPAPGTPEARRAAHS